MKDIYTKHKGEDDVAIFEIPVYFFD